MPRSTAPTSQSANTPTAPQWSRPAPTSKTSPCSRSSEQRPIQRPQRLTLGTDQHALLRLATRPGATRLPSGEADRPQPDHRVVLQPHPRAVIQVSAPPVVPRYPALQHRHERALFAGVGGPQLAQLAEVGDGAGLVLGDRQMGSGEPAGAAAVDGGGFAHPVLRCRPVQAADLGVVAGDRRGVLAGAGAPFRESGDFAEPAGVQRPPVSGPAQRLVLAQGPVRDEQGEAGGVIPQPVRLVGAQVEHQRVLLVAGFDPRAFRRAGVPGGRKARGSNPATRSTRWCSTWAPTSRTGCGMTPPASPCSSRTGPCASTRRCAGPLTGGRWTPAGSAKSPDSRNGAPAPASTPRRSPATTPRSAACTGRHRRTGCANPPPSTAAAPAGSPEPICRSPSTRPAPSPTSASCASCGPPTPANSARSCRCCKAGYRGTTGGAPTYTTGWASGWRTTRSSGWGRSAAARAPPRSPG